MAGLFSSNTLEQIRAASDIVDVIGSYLPLKRAGANFVALCPFHKEKTPSFNVNPHRQIFHCFGCHKGGDVFTFVKEYESLDFVEAVKRLADRAKIPLEYEQGAGQQESKHLKDTLLQIHEQIAQRWHNCLLNEAAGQVARDYLQKRGVSAEAIKLFRIGAAPEAWDDTVNWAKSKSHDLATVEKSGLIIHKEETGNYYDRFRGRLMFPICDEQGRVIGFSGRVLSGDEKTAKYVNSPETPIFTKSKVFFGLDKSKRAILDAGFAIICEGQLDLIACFMGGVQNIVAPQGTAFTDQHARILKRYVNEVVLCFDSDEAGQNAAVRSLDHLLASGLAVRVAVVPAPHDPDSFIKANGGEAFRKVIEGAESYFDYYLGRLCVINDVKTDRGRAAIVESMMEALLKTNDIVITDKYALKTALRLEVPHRTIKIAYQRLSQNRSGGATNETSATREETLRPPDQEFWLLKLVLGSEEKLEWIRKNLDLDWLENSTVRQILSLYLSNDTAEENARNPSSMLSQLDASAQALVTEILVDKRSIPNVDHQLTELFVRLRNKSIDRQMNILSEKMHDETLSHPQKLDLLVKQQELRQLKRQPIGRSGD